MIKKYVVTFVVLLVGCYRTTVPIKTVSDARGAVEIVREKDLEGSVSVQFRVLSGRKLVFTSGVIDFIQQGDVGLATVGDPFMIRSVSNACVIVKMANNPQEVVLGFYAYDLMDGYPRCVDASNLETIHEIKAREEKLRARFCEIAKELGLAQTDDMATHLGASVVSPQESR